MNTRPVGLVLLFLSLFFPFIHAQSPRERIKFDFSWKFHSGDTYKTYDCNGDSFPINMTTIQCAGLKQATQATNQDECIQACCADPACAVWQWCPPGANNCNPAGTCWIGQMNSCTGGGTGWISGGRNSTPPVGDCTNPFCEPTYDDSQWRNLDVPHDYVIEGTFTPSGDESHGYLPHGIAWYRKHFTLPSTDSSKILTLYFDGIYRNSDTYLNGFYLGTHTSGYTSFYYDITKFAFCNGSDNVLAIRADATQDEGWWYEGGGIYRHVWLDKTNPIHIIPWGIYAPSIVTGTTSRKPITMITQEKKDWTVEVTATSVTLYLVVNVTNNGTSSTSVNLISQVIDPSSGQAVGNPATFASFSVAPNGERSVGSSTLNLTGVTLWDVTAPKLYTIVTTVYNSDKSQIYDQVNITTGFRKTLFDSKGGFYLNDFPVKVKGLCNHQDFAGTGVAVPDRVNEFRVRKIREMGGNGWRMSHNPPNPELLDLTDSLGILVWDETRYFDKTPQALEDMGRMIQRDRNHPSIILWSLCNEGACGESTGDQNALDTAQQLTTVVHTYDPINTRPVSAAWNANQNDLIGGWGPIVLDVQGINYNYFEYDPYHESYPTKPIIGSETASCTCARGIYVTNDTAVHKDVYSADGCAQQWWSSVATRPFVEGGFAWTGFDYKGEPTPYAWPDVNSNFGIIDLAGFPKDTFYYYQANWISNVVLHVFPHWNPLPASTEIGTYVSSCSSTAKSQKWNFTGSGTTPGIIQSLDLSNKCIAGNCSNIGSGCSTMSLVDCNPNDSAQQWVYSSGDLNFKNSQSGGCMDIWNGGTGPNIGIYQCDYLPNQKWQYNTSTYNIISLFSTDDVRCINDNLSPDVWAYSNAASVELFINGNSQGKRTVPQYGHVSWSVSYDPGTLSAIAYDSNGGVVAKQTIQTTGDPTAIVLTVEFPTTPIRADSQDVVLIRVSVIDSQNLEVPTASNIINFSVTGAGILYGVGNGDPGCHEPDKGNSRSLFNGLARVIIQSTNTPGTITLTATSNGLKSATIQLSTV